MVHPIFVAEPYTWEKEFYRAHKIPLWSIDTNETRELDLGFIYQGKDGYIRAKVNAHPAQFWDFEIYSKESRKIVKFSTGSGGLTDYYPIAEKILQDMVNIISVEEVRPNEEIVQQSGSAEKR